MLQIIIFLTALVITVTMVGKLYRKYGKRLIWWVLVTLAGLALVVLVATGRLHWLGIVAAALIAGFKTIISLLLRLPFLHDLLQLLARRKMGQQNTPSEVASERMSKAEALDILGLEQNATRDQIIAAHKRLVQRVHPDHEGSEHLTRKINQARDTLLNSSQT